MKSSTTLVLTAALIALFTRDALAQTLVIEGLQFPQRLIFSPGGNLLVSEGGTTQPNTARISIVNRQGARRSLIEGLPGASSHGIPAFGPGGLALDGQTLYIAMGEGDTNVGPPFVINTEGPSSPIFHSILQIQFSADVDTIDSTFSLAEHHWALLDGNDIYLTNAGGHRAVVRLLSAFRPLVRNVLGGTGRTRVSDPYSLSLDPGGKTLYVVDSASETVLKVNTDTGRSMVITRFQPDERLGPAGPQFVDNVPTAICPVDGGFLVSFLTANPYPQGRSSVRMWTPDQGAWSRPSTVFDGLTMTNDMICSRRGGVFSVITVEYSLDPANRDVPSGRIQMFAGTDTRVLADKLHLPISVAQDPSSGDIYFTTLPGRIFRLPAP
jgi:DNA-binding beta-propeller fold protein YncE